MSELRDSAGSERQFKELLEFVQEEIGFETSVYNQSYLDRRVSARMRRVDASTYREYLRLLRSSPGEQDELTDALSINVTSFFRNPEVWQELRGVLANLTSGHGNASCWSVPCADGREPYSIAMLADEDPTIAEQQLHIEASDIDTAALQQAREAVYESSRTTDIRDELGVLSDPMEYVTDSEETFTVRDRITSRVEFSKHDLIRDQPKDGFDLVLCRNLLIYIDTEYKQDIFETLTGSLVEGGYLMIGQSETLHRSVRDQYESVADQMHLYKKV